MWYCFIYKIKKHVFHIIYLNSTLLCPFSYEHWWFPGFMIEWFWTLVFLQRFRRLSLVPKTCGRGSCYHHKGLCCGHCRSERAGWDSLGRHRMVSTFMSGVRRLRPVRPIGVPSWDLSVVLEGLMIAPFEPLESAPEWILTLKVTLLLALMYLKIVGDLQPLSVDVYGCRPGFCQGDIAV